MNTRNTNRFRPLLEALDGRIVPATNYFNGGDPFVGSNWSLGHYPTYSEDVVFDGTHTTDDCTLTAIGPFTSVQLVNGYPGTVTHTTSLWMNTLVVEGGALNPSANSKDVTVSQSFTWTGGILNSSSFLSSVTITGSTATALFAPASGGTVWLGSSISLANGAAGTMEEGTIDLNKAGIEFSTSTGSSLDIAPNSAPVILGVTQYLNGIIGSGSSWTVKADASVAFKGQLTNNGTLALLAGSTATVAGKPMIAVAYSQGVGAATDLHGSSTLATAADKKVILAGGRLATVYDDDVGNANATIRTDLLEVAGTDIYIAYQGANYDFGELLVDGDVLWTGGTFHTKVWCDGMTNDVWRTTNASGNGAQFDINAGAIVEPIFVDSDYGTSSLPTSGDDWEILKAGGGFADATAPAVSDTGTWEMEIDVVAPPIYWKLIAK
ncbi:MAG: hypothetical protein L0241_09920 [Planctomycetia bacterium]|nr:hypothetical protein [Planctomycetia bacterium]